MAKLLNFELHPHLQDKNFSDFYRLKLYYFNTYIL